MFISTNHRVITVGKMMARTLVTFVGWPAAAWIRPARTEPAPGEEDVEEGGQGEVDGLLGHHQLQGGRLVGCWGCRPGLGDALGGQAV
jgi:hypothetical protein